ncbi:lytic transglycosylase domain-containing protein [Sphingomicrobium lutaoense]|uniref:Transglycosylase SLT domain-containing protein n=1 Tax=Sphingomicrobium lutaoense TaxID=515949 RepID=A0A839Z2D0_9SPHN|nr:lytic transglycosylase domain-containing protein [Sphingomicrobium lutaoense]MBB3763745.1 hypothetical protein [Sphingomicrobium lutaoense]
MSLTFLLAALGVQAQDPLAPLPQPAPPPAQERQVVAPPAYQLPEPTAPNVLGAIAQKRWDIARALVDRMDRRDPMESYVRAELYLAAGSPEVSAAELVSLIERGRDLPQAAQLARLAQRRGAGPQPVAAQQPIVSLGSAPRRVRARPVDDPGTEEVRTAIRPYIEADDPEPAEAIYRDARDRLSRDALAEIAQKVAFIYYVVGRDQDARRIAADGRANGSGEWAARASYLEGLAAWRAGDCDGASSAFRWAALATGNREIAAGGHYWSARAEQACRRPHQVAARMRAAAEDVETFYGQVARLTLGMDRRPPERVEAPRPDHIRRVEDLPNVRRAIAFAGIGYRGHAEDLLKHQARIGSPEDHRALLEIAKRHSLAGAQYWLATNGPRGAKTDVADRYPAPSWNPENGWRIDPYMAYAHIIQESDFREWVVSPADAVGLMQVRPGTARDTARRRGQTVSVDMLKRAETNIDHGQEFIALTRSDRYFQDQLPRIIAAYNAGPVPVRRWNGIRDNGDPLLWMESLPYWETRGYVPAVLRNYFVYHALAGNEPSALKGLAEHRWPTYPTR